MYLVPVVNCTTLTVHSRDRGMVAMMSSIEKRDSRLEQIQGPSSQADMRTEIALVEVRVLL